jgi:Transposase, Mutator family
VGDSEAQVYWRAFLRSQKERGPAGVRLAISDQHAGLAAALGRVFQGVGHQPCRAISGPLGTAKAGRSRCLPGKLRSLETRLDAP